MPTPEEIEQIKAALADSGVIGRLEVLESNAERADKGQAEELRLLRKIATAADGYQLASKYVAGDFKQLYEALVEYRSWLSTRQP